MEISNQFIEQLFSHPQFRSQFQSFWASFQNQINTQNSTPQSYQIQSVVEDISQLFESNFKTAVQQQYSHIYESNRYVLEQIQQLKAQLKHSPTLKTQSSTAERDTNPKLQTSIFFETDSQYDMKQIRRQFDDSIENRILTNSFQLDQQDKTYQEIQDKINASLQGSINRIQLTLQEKFEKYSAKIQQMIEQLRKTIASVVEAMNQKEYWANQSPKSHNNSNKHNRYNAFTKKQHKSNQQQKQRLSNDKKDMIKQHQIQSSIKNPQKQKQNLTTLPNPQSNSNKTIQSLNKSINIGRTKIKSLFGFKSTSGNTNDKEKNQNE